jgi:hypothetical protein
VVDALAHRVGQVLVQRATARDVDDLGAPADREHGQGALVGGAHELELEGVQPGLRGPEARMWLGPVGGGMDVGPAGQAEPVDAVEERATISDAKGGITTGTPPACCTASR